MGDLTLFVGSLNRAAPYFQGARGKGLAVFGLDEASLRVTLLAETDEVDNPSFLSVCADGKYVYTNSEVFAWREGVVSAYAFDRAAGLRYLNKQPALGSITAHNAVTKDGSKLLVVNYGMGEGGPDQSLVVFGIGPDGALTAPLASAAHRGTGPNRERQERSHAHSVLELDGGILLVADLGIDRLVRYRLGEDGSLTRLGEQHAAPGAGPRHMVSDPAGRFVFVMNELDSTVASFALGPEGELAPVDSKPAVPEAAKAGNHCADIQISPDGCFIYGTNRGHDSIAIFAVDGGRLEPIGHVPCGGATPRNLALTPSGSLALSANQNADRVSIFARDAATGLLSDTGAAIEVGTPMCVKAVG